MFIALPNELAEAVEAARARLGPFADVHFQSEVDSTNDLALALADAGAPAGTSVMADLQRKGRGRRGREWFSPPGTGLYLSVIARPTHAGVQSALITLAAGVAAATAVRRASGLPVELKWPNDLVIGRPWRKLGGILTEASSKGGRLEAVVVGIGVNVSSGSYPPELSGRATAIETELGRAVLKGALLVSLLEELRAVLAWCDRDNPAALVVPAWRPLGRRALDNASVRWTTTMGERRGRTRDLGADGALVVETEGRIERILAGEVVWEELTHE